MPRLTQYFCLALLALASGQSVRAQNAAMMELYGQAVHSYYCHDYMAAQQMLSQVVASGSVDPRAHYFLGLTQEMLGADGQSDFDAGARYEAEGRQVVQVGAALSRVQGSLRTKIEKARRSARIMVLQEKLAEQAARAKMTPKPDPAAVPPTPSITESPFDAGMTSPDKVPAADAAPAPADVASDPFGDDPEPAAGDPFAAEPAAADPFGAQPAADDPFATGSDAPASGADPFDAGGADPFDTGGADPFETGGDSNPFE